MDRCRIANSIHNFLLYDNNKLTLILQNFLLNYLWLEVNALRGRHHHAGIHGLKYNYKLLVSAQNTINHKIITYL